ncbi:riboflavin transporter [Streptococcus pneumoniae]|nr:riboflavin transporter [Streptococcus pneumoniae]
MTNTRRLSTIAILSAISFVLMYFDFPLLPAASFLKIEFSILPVLVGGSGGHGFACCSRSALASLTLEVAS